ncbi:MAG TPA: M15 family metallopeptidase [Candidatus Competibacteraceae bacterium]|nr:M15 family metallopeptidase [Candidatus Competibacteraceae bacterium]
MIEDSAYHRRIAALHRELGIPADYACNRPLYPQAGAHELVAAGADIYGRPQRMTAATLAHWQAMRAAAAGDGVALQLVSAFRDIDYQAGLIRRKLERGLAIADILRVNAAPGYSEHHSGRALDLTTPGCAVLEQAFEETAAFAWLMRQAGCFGFVLSFPRDNPHGVIYEPWHWCFHD